MSAQGLVVCDLDGVVWVGEEPVEGAARAVARLRDAGARVLFLTNNSSLRLRDVSERLRDAGIDASTDEILTSAIVTAELLTHELGRHARVLSCAGRGVHEALRKQGLEVVDEAPCDAVVVGWHRTFDFDELERASTAVREGAWFVATNVDATYPTAHGLIPGNGALVAAIATAAGVEPVVAGKPEAPTAEAVRSRGRSGGGVVVGDRPSTDGALAEMLGWPFVLVRSDVTASEGNRDRAADAEGADLESVADATLQLLGH